MTKLWLECVIPEADLHYAAALPESRHVGVQEITDYLSTLTSSSSSSSSSNSSSSSSSSNVQNGDDPRNVFTYDGAWNQMQAMLRRVNPVLLTKGYEGVKFAAASTMVEQPNDVGHIHKAIKNFFKNNRYRKSKQWSVPDNLWGFDDILTAAGLESASMHTYWKALCHMELCFSKTCTISMVKEGYRISGIFPVDNNIIMSGWSGWTTCSKEQADDVLERLPILTEIAKMNGRITDIEIEECMEGILEFDPSTRKSDDIPLNHSRCLWANNSRVIESHRQKSLDIVMKGVEKDNILMEKEFRIQYPDEAAAEDARNSAAVEVETASAKQGRSYKCSSSACNIVGTKVDRKNWTGCRVKSCTLLFCWNCADASQQHQSKCNRATR